MNHTLRHKRLFLLVFALAALGLVVVGARVPHFRGLSAGKAKPRPRAVIQTQVKVCQHCLEQQVQQCDVISGIVLPPDAAGLSLASFAPFLADVTLPGATVPARASPAV